ncbi:MAG: hypothetical protein EBR59_01090 [Methylococcaceae bacterium]|nr:hypothetical protein [Methylococcaceae bacterium]
MKSHKILLKLSFLLFTLGSTEEASAKTTVELLEKKINELEARLARYENGSSAKEIAPTVSLSENNQNTDLNKLKTKVNLLERKIEVDKEVYEASASKMPKFDAGADGFRITSQDGRHQVRIRGAVQADGRFFAEDHGGVRTAGVNNLGTGSVSGIPDQFQLKQARVWLEGKFFDNIYFKIMPDFAANNILPDAYLDYAYKSYAGLSVGKQKTPLSLERLQGDADGMFLERAYPTYLANNRDVGIMLHGEFAKPGYKAEYGGPVDFKNFISYQLGVFNGAGDNASLDKSSAGTFDDKEFDGRLWSHPFQHSGHDWLEGLGLGVAGSWSRPTGLALNKLTSAIGSNSILDYGFTKVKTATVKAGALSSPSYLAALTGEGDHIRIYPQAYWYAGPLGFMGEYVLSEQNLNAYSPYKTSGKAAHFKQKNSAWQAQLSYVLTGEDATFQGVKPIRIFNPSEGTWGALQAAVRFSDLNIDPDTFNYLDPTRNIREAKSWAVGLNWFLTQNAVVRADYEETYFTGGDGSITGTGTNTSGDSFKYSITDRTTEKVFATRFQLAF